jgi:hypothetical protein
MFVAAKDEPLGQAGSDDAFPAFGIALVPSIDVVAEALR